jgi:2-polyprenyl-3-methyl-5-hydroxy-6-metoxy-1,4-benzoquinol methylase
MLNKNFECTNEVFHVLKCFTLPKLHSIDIASGLIKPTYVTSVSPQSAIPKLEECWFYHVMDLPSLGTVNHFGSWDLRGRFDDYIGHTPLSGKTLLDVGTASGFLSFEAEKRGAVVTSFDVPSGDTVNIDPRTDAGEKRAEITKLHNSYRLAHRLLGSRAQSAYGDALELSRHVGPHEIVLIGQMLVHVRDPLAVLEQACKVARETIIIVEGSFESEVPVARFYGAQFPGTNSWWHLSTGLYRDAFGIFGFAIKQATKSTYLCNHPAQAGKQEIWTFVAERK